MNKSCVGIIAEASGDSRWFRMKTNIRHNTTRHTMIPFHGIALRFIEHMFYRLLRVFIFISVISSSSNALAQCDVEVSAIMPYCNSFRGNNVIPGYFIGFRVKSINGDTLNVIDLNGNVPMNLGKRIDDINTEFEPSDTSRTKVRIAGGIDSLEFWYFGPFTNGDSFHIVLVDPTGECDTIEVAEGTFTCVGQDPNACDSDVPLYYLDFSASKWNVGGGGGGNENVDQIFLIMQRSREATCCQTGNENCFEFIIHLDEDDIGLLIDDVGNGSTGGKIFADSLNGFACGTNQANTWPFYQENGQSSDEPLCLSGSARDWIVLSCKHGNNVTGVSFGTVGTINVLPEHVYENCTVNLEVLNATTANWSSDDDPNLDNLNTSDPDSLTMTFSYDKDIFGPVINCTGDTFVYFIEGLPDNTCLEAGTYLKDTTYVVVYPDFDIIIDSTCIAMGDSLLLEATLITDNPACYYSILWSTGDTTQSIIVPNQSGDYSVNVIRPDLEERVVDCDPASASIHIEPYIIICQDVSDILYQCPEPIPPPDTTLISAAGCNINPIVFYEENNNNGIGCPGDPLIITRIYVVDFDGDTVGTITDRDSCVQEFIFIDDTGPIIACPPNITIGCTDPTLPQATGVPTVIDNCDSMPGYTYSDQVIPGTCPSELTISRTWIASDQCGNTSSCIQSISVRDEIPPSISCPINLTIDCSASIDPGQTGFATATDDCDPAPELTYADVLSTASCPYSITRTWTASDDCGNTSTCQQIISLIDTLSPSITCPLDVTIECAENTLPVFTGSATGVDNCDPQLSPTYIDLIQEGSCPFNWIIIRTWTLSDDCLNSSSCIQTITVNDTQPPVISCPADITVACLSDTNNLFFGMPSVSDLCDPMPSMIHSDVLVDSLCPHQIVIERTWTVSDACGNAATCLQILTVRDSIPPSLACPADVTLGCTDDTNPPSTGTASAMDNCDISAGVSHLDSIVPGSCPSEFEIYRVWTATDVCANETSCTQVISIKDQAPPSITCPPSITIQYAEITLPTNTGTASATDNCDPDPTITYTDLVVDTCPVQKVLIRTWIATDLCGNSSSCQQLIYIEERGSVCGNVNDDFGNAVIGVEIQLYVDIDGSGSVNAGDILYATMLTDSNGYCFDSLYPCEYVLKEIQPAGYGDSLDYDLSPDPDGDDSLQGPDNEIPVELAPLEIDSNNQFTDILCPLLLPVLQNDTICDNGSVLVQIDSLMPGDLSYLWDFGSGSTPSGGTGIGPHVVSYITTTDNQLNDVSIVLTVGKEGCPELTGPVKYVTVNPYPDPAIDASTGSLCYFTIRTFKPIADSIPGATYHWNFGANAVPSSATGYGPHNVYYTTSGTANVSLVIYPNAAGAQCPDSSSISFMVNVCPSNITGSVKSVSGAGIQGVNLKLYADVDTNGIADNGTAIRSVFSTSTGAYSMVGLTPGSYVVIQTQPNLWYTIDDEDTSEDFDIVENIDSLDNLIPVTLGASEIDAHNIFTETAIPGVISGAVFRDIDGDEVPDEGEGLTAVSIYLYADQNRDGQADDSIILQTVTTSSNGNYSFNNVPIGNYVIVENNPSGYNSIKDFDASSDQDSVENINMLDDTIPVTVFNLENDAHNYFIEELECSLLVMNTNDDGDGSLRSMCACAEEGDTIRFDSSLASQTILITSSRIEIVKSIIIDSDCDPHVTIASTIPGLLDVGVGATVELRDLDIISGVPGHLSAAFNNYGTLILHNIQIYRNPALPPGNTFINNQPGGEIIFSGNCMLMFN